VCMKAGSRGHCVPLVCGWGKKMWGGSGLVGIYICNVLCLASYPGVALPAVIRCDVRCVL
jgi:hypothetical protein